MELTANQKRVALFLGGCVTTRVFFAYLAWCVNPITHLPLLGALALLPAVGFMYIYLTGSRQTGPETMGAPIWWNTLRPIHALLWGLFAVLALFGVHRAWLILALDVVFGTAMFLAKSPALREA